MGGGPQSAGQSIPLSSASHKPSPQQGTSAGSFLHANPLLVQRLSLQSTGWYPPPAPQQNWLLGLPLCTPLQSCGQLKQSSPSAPSQMPLPQLALLSPQQPQASPAPSPLLSY